MKVLVTGASGFIGAGVGRALRAHGHHVLGLARSTASAERLRRSSVEPVFGALEEPERLRSAVTGVDAVVHAAFARHGTDDMSRAGEVETEGVRALLEVVGDRPIIYTSGLGVVGETGSRPVTDADPVHPPPGMAWRRALELDTMRAAHGVVIRPPLVYGHASGLVLTGLIEAALAAGASHYPLPGDNSWPNVHVDDLAEAFALALSAAPAGTVLNVVGGVSTPRAVAEAIGRLIGRPEATTGLPPEKARDVMPFADWLGTNQVVDATTTRAVLDWQPTRPAVTDDIATGSYRRFAAQ